MKKILAFMLSTVFFIGLFTINVFADNEVEIPYPGYNYGDSYQPRKAEIITACSNPDSLAYGGFKSRQTYDYYFAYIDCHNNNDFLRLVYFDCQDVVYDEQNGCLKKEDGSSFNWAFSGWYAGQGAGSSSGTDTSFSLATGYDTVPIQVILQDTNLKIKGYNDFDPNNPPAPFTYTIDRPGFSLKNGNDKVYVQIRWTDEYIEFCNKLHSLQPSVQHDLGYNFCIYISTVKPTNTETLLSSMNSVNFIHLNYSEYVYEGGAGSPALSDSSMTSSDVPTSMSGKSPWTTAKGVNICEVSEPDKDPTTGKYTNSTLFIPFYTENVYGLSEHQNIYVCVLGRNSSSNQPNVFNEYNVQYDLTGHSTPNDTYCQYFVSHTESESDTPDYTLHNYYFPFECVNLAFGDGYQGNTTYLPQVVNGKEYETHSPITSFTNKAITPDLLHDIDMDEGQWVKPEDYHAWQVDYYNKHQYDSNYEFGVQSFKDIFEEEGSFFKFISSAFSVFPSYVMNIFIAFLVAFLAIVLLKLVL